MLKGTCAVCGKTKTQFVKSSSGLFPQRLMVLLVVWCGGNLPLGDLVGKGELAQGSSNGLRTIHDLA